MYKTPDIFKVLPQVTAAESTRLCGNLGLFTQDQKEVVLANRQRFFASLGFTEEQAAHSFQCHSDKILVVDAPQAADGYDALITNGAEIYLCITIADCTPVLIYDPLSGSIAAIHAGWRGTVARIVEKTIQAMTNEFGASPSSCLAYVGTCIDFQNFEVGEEVAVHFPEQFKRPGEKAGKFFVDLKATNKAQLLAAGLQSDNIEVSTFSTFKHNDQYFSHRKEHGKTGRMLVVIGKKRKN